MYHDLYVPYISNQAELQQTLAFLDHLGYDTVALDHAYTGKVPSVIKNEIPTPLPYSIPPRLKILRRCTLHLSDPSQNHRLSNLAAAYDILALRPTTEAALQQACQATECDLVSLDLSLRFPFHFKSKTISAALQRGVKFEICYAPAIQNGDGGLSKRNLIGNATQLIRAARSRGILISSEAKSALACRSPADTINLAVLWGLAEDRAREAVSQVPGYVVANARMKRQRFRGVIDVVSGGEKPPQAEKSGESTGLNGTTSKRKVDDLEADEQATVKTVSRRERKRQARTAKLQEVQIDQGPQTGKS